MSHILYDKLIEYGKNGKYPFHMPGHKRNDTMLSGMDPFDIDITEIADFDNLHHPQGIIKEAMDRAASYYGTDRTWFLINGSSCGILAAINSVTDIGDKIIIGRNCHKAVYNAMTIRNLKGEYFYPEYVSELGINGGYNPEILEKLLRENKDTKAVVITSPTYDGIVSDIEKIAEITHKYGAVLIVDEAHGAHFRISDKLPTPAYKLGADLVIESVHKTLPSMTQTAVLHKCGNRVKEEEVEKSLGIYQSSSPSYVLMASIDRCIDVIENYGDNFMGKLLIALNNFRSNVNKLKSFYVPGKEIVGKLSVYDMDPTKLVICIKAQAWDGKWLSDILRKHYGFEMEMEAPEYVLGITGICDDLSQIQRLYESLKEIDSSISYKEKTCDAAEFELTRNDRAMSVYEAQKSESVPVKIEEAQGKVSGEFLYLYPPGIPLLVPGEVISHKLISQVKEFKKMNMNIKGLADMENKYIKVIK